MPFRGSDSGRPDRSAHVYEASFHRMLTLEIINISDFSRSSEQWDSSDLHTTVIALTT